MLCERLICGLAALGCVVGVLAQFVGEVTPLKLVLAYLGVSL